MLLLVLNGGNPHGLEFHCPDEWDLLPDLLCGTPMASQVESEDLENSTVGASLSNVHALTFLFQHRL